MLLMMSMPSALKMEGTQSIKVMWTSLPFRALLEKTAASTKVKRAMENWQSTMLDQEIRYIRGLATVMSDVQARLQSRHQPCANLRCSAMRVLESEKVVHWPFCYGAMLQTGYATDVGSMIRQLVYSYGS